MPPEDEYGQHLARRLGELLERGEPLDRLREGDAEGEPSLEPALLAYKAQQAGQDEQPGLDASERMWRGIEGHLHPPAAARPSRLRRVVAWNPLRHQRAWYALAASLVVLMGFLWYLARPSSPALVAEAEDTPVVYEAPDGSRVTLRPHSRLLAVARAEGLMQYRLDGEGYFDIVRDTLRQFQVEVDGGLITVIGTRFNVSTWGGRAAVYLEEGRVRFEPDLAGEAVTMRPGERSYIDEAGVLHTPEAAPAREALDWMEGQLHFDQQPLFIVAAELAQHFGLILDVPPSQREDSITGRILLADAEQSLRDLATILGGRFVPAGENEYRLVYD
jgi:transmembrane sensor